MIAINNIKIGIIHVNNTVIIPKLLIIIDKTRDLAIKTNSIMEIKSMMEGKIIINKINREVTTGFKIPRAPTRTVICIEVPMNTQVTNNSMNQHGVKVTKNSPMIALIIK